MKFHLTRAAGRNLFTGYGDGYVAINDQRFERNVVVRPEGEVTDWRAESFDTLEPAHFEALLEFNPEIVLLGTGERLRFPHPQLTRSLAEARIGFEVMDTKAVCRTFNILMSEGREVLAAILV